MPVCARHRRQIRCQGDDGAAVCCPIRPAWAAAWITVLFRGAVRSAGGEIQCTAIRHPFSPLGALLAVPLPACAMSSTPPPASPPAATAATGLADATERAIVQAVDAGNADALALLERIVNINSGTMNFA